MVELKMQIENMTSNIKDYVLLTLTNLLRIHVVVSFSIASTSSTWKNWLKSFYFLFLCWVDFFFFFKPWHILLLHMICVLTTWENNNEINLKKFTKLNFFVDWWVRFGWIFCLFFFFSLYIYYFCIWHVFWRHEKRKMKLTWKNLLTQYFCGLIMAKLGWIFFFSLDIYYFVFWLHDRRKMKYWLIFYSYLPI